MIYNNAGTAEGLENAWGLAAWIEYDQQVLLFDTGGDPEILSANMETLRLDPGKIDKIFISHDHWDHMGGLEMVLGRMDKKPDLYITANTENTYREKYPGAKIIPVSTPVQIDDHAWSTGSFETIYKNNKLQEHSLILVNDDSMVLLAGCSHPGITEITERVLLNHPEKKLLLVTGGFHLAMKTRKKVVDISGQLKEMGVQKIAPSHCTGESSVGIFEKNWGEDFVNLNLGDSFVF